MKQSMQFFALIIFALLVVFPLPAISGVTISLSNGRDIIADSCSDLKDRLVCEKLGGTFEIDKKDILKVSGIRTGEKPSGMGAVDASGEEKKDGTPEMKSQAGSSVQETEISGAGEKEKGEKEKIVRGTDPEAEKRLDEIHEKKVQLSRESEELNRERQQLKEEMKNGTDMFTSQQIDDLNARNSDLESRISRFNGQVRALSDEERKIIEGLRTKEQDQQQSK